MKIRTLSVKQARELDRRAKSDFGIPTLILMENAGIGLAHHINNFLIQPSHRCRVPMFCGTGNNGGDAFVAARHLLRKGIQSEIFLVGEEEKMEEDAAVNYRIIKKLGIHIEPASRFSERQKEWSGVPVLIIDAIIGTGFKPPLREPVQNLIREINYFKKFHNVSVKALAVDIPSGLDGDDGVVSQDVLRAEMTVTFACLKKGMTLPESRPFVGRTEVVDIGIPDSLLQEVV